MDAPTRYLKVVPLFFTLSVGLDLKSVVNCSLCVASDLEAQGQVVLPRPWTQVAAATWCKALIKKTRSKADIFARASLVLGSGVAALLPEVRGLPAPAGHSPSSFHPQLPKLRICHPDYEAAHSCLNTQPEAQHIVLMSSRKGLFI